MKKIVICIIFLTILSPIVLSHTQAAQDYNSSRSNKAKGEAIVQDVQISIDGEGCPDTPGTVCATSLETDENEINENESNLQEEKNYIELGSIKGEAYERSGDRQGVKESYSGAIEKANHNTTRSNQASGVKGVGGDDCDDTDKLPENCSSSYVEVELKITETDTEKQDTKREKLKKRFDINEKKYERSKKQISTRTDKIFGKLDEEKISKIQERLESILEKNIEKENSQVIEIIIILQDILEGRVAHLKKLADELIN